MPSGFWDDPVITWDDPNVSWDGNVLTAAETATLQSVATFSAEGYVAHRDAETTMYVVATFDIIGALVEAATSTLQAVATWEAVPPGAEAVEGETTMQAAATFASDGVQVEAATSTMQAAATFLAEVAARALAGETTMQSVATMAGEARATVIHEAETELLMVAFMDVDGERRARATGEWYIRGGTYYPPPFNRRKMMRRAHLGTGRRVG